MNSFQPHAIIHSIVLTEKSMNLKAMNKYVFHVAPKANKIEVAKAVEAIHAVKVADVNMLIRKGKVKRVRGRRTFGRQSDRKYAIVTLAEGSIELI